MPYSSLPELPDWFWYPVTFLYGAIVGSFLNVIIYRLPLGMSISTPPSQCPNCGTKLSLWDNIPLIAFLSLGARCRYCRTPISWRYFTIELLTACLWVALYHRVSGTSGISWVNYVAEALFASVLVAMIFIDLDHFFAPDELNIVGFSLGLARDAVCLALAWSGGRYLWNEFAPQYSYFGWLPRAIPGALAYGGVLFAVSLLGFVYYAREEKESLAHVFRRFPLWDKDETTDETQIGAVFVTPSASAEVNEDVTEEEQAENPEETDEEQDEPPRLRLSPGFITLMAALLLVPVVRYWALAAVLIPVTGFVLLARQDDESVVAAFRRFFSTDEDKNYAGETVLVPEPDPTESGTALGPQDSEETLSASEMQALMKSEADQFAREAESGKHGGMGLGDVKLALAVGAVLGPALALLSLLVATFLGATVGIIIARRSGRSLRYGVPFVPFMAAGAIVVMLYGPSLLDWYMGLTAPSAAAPPPMTAPLRVRARGPRVLPGR